MAKAKKTTKQEQFEMILAQFKEIADTRNLKEEVVLSTFENSLQRAYAKSKGGDDVKAEVHINYETFDFDITYYKTVVATEDEIEDDALQLVLEDALKIDPNAVVGEEIIVEKLVREDMDARVAKNAGNNFRQQLIEIEKEQLFLLYKDKIDEMVLGTIETSGRSRGTTVNIGSTTVSVDERKNLIPGETFTDGQLVPFYVVDVVAHPKTGANIIISRTHPGFVKRLMEKEVHEIYDGTVVIHNIVREAGERCKVAVESLDPNVDPVGACIGPNGQRIQKVSAELGPHGKKEKVDIIPFNSNIGLYIIESFRPATPLGVSVDEKAKSATVIVANDDKGRAFGQKGANIRLASLLTGYKISLLTVDEALASGVTYKDKEALVFDQNIADQEKARLRIKEEQAALDKEYAEKGIHVPGRNVLPPVESGIEEYGVTNNDIPETVAALEEEVVATPEVEVPTTVKTTISLAALERELEEERIAPKETQEKYRKRKAAKEVEEKIDINVPTGPKMDIYTEEELKRLEQEEVSQNDFEEDDFSDYDDDEFYE